MHARSQQLAVLVCQGVLLLHLKPRQLPHAFDVCVNHTAAGMEPHLSCRRSAMLAAAGSCWQLSCRRAQCCQLQLASGCSPPEALLEEVCHGPCAGQVQLINLCQQLPLATCMCQHTHSNPIGQKARHKVATQQCRNMNFHLQLQACCAMHVRAGLGCADCCCAPGRALTVLTFVQ